jgi:hypothetical protein
MKSHSPGYSKIWIAILILTPLLWASVGGSITGTVKDSTGAVIVGAPVSATNTATKVRKMAITDDRGVYTFAVLPVGDYDIEVNQSGFKPYRRTSVTLDTDSRVVVDAVLHPGERTDTVTVSERARFTPKP